MTPDGLGPDEPGWEWRRELLAEAGAPDLPESFERAREAYQEMKTRTVEPAVCTCRHAIVDTLDETLRCPLPWAYLDGIGWGHVPAYMTAAGL